MEPPGLESFGGEVKRVTLWLSLFWALAAQAAENPSSPDQIYGSLFAAVQRAKVFPDQKTFVDCVPREDPDVILKTFEREKGGAGFDLGNFVRAHFLVPEVATISVPAKSKVADHVKVLWPLLQRSADTAVKGSSLLPLPYPYIVPGGRFREIYYWDSYFTMLGLRESGREDLINDLVQNFTYLEKTYGHIPNGNRSYFLSRSQPPFFALMLDLLAEKNGEQVYADHLDALKTEYAYWMDRSAKTHHVVPLSDAVVLSRYYDQLASPRPEAFAKEEETAGRSQQRSEPLYRNLRAAAESGWDFSSRWFADGKNLETIETLEVVPVDLNCLLQHLEVTLARAYRQSGDNGHAGELETLAARRKAAILKTFWSEKEGYFFDFNTRTKQLNSAWTLAGIAPLFFHLATPEQAAKVAANIRARFLKPGGVVTTLVSTGQQWDAPNGWAPLEWMTIRGLENYGEHDLATEIAKRWLALNDTVYRQTGKMMEKYNVVDLSVIAGGGEYPSQDGFGWTNGVYLKLLHDYPQTLSR